MARLSAFVRTPRAAKRLINVYRLLKCITGPEATSALKLGGDFTVLLQLALLCGMPEEARLIFEQIQRSRQLSLWDAVNELGAGPMGSTQGHQSSAVLSEAVEAMLSFKSTGEVTTDTWKYWAPLTARFAFLRPEL